MENPANLTDSNLNMIKHLSDSILKELYQERPFQKLVQWLKQSRPELLPRNLATAIVAITRKVSKGVNIDVRVAYFAMMRAIGDLLQRLAKHGEIEISPDMLERLQGELGQAWDGEQGDMGENPNRTQPQGQPQNQPMGPMSA